MNDNKDIMAVEISISSDEDVIIARQKTRSLALEMGFSMLAQTKLITAVSELARNIVVHAGQGGVSVYRVEEKKGIRVVFEDNGPGIPDIKMAMEEGYSTVGSLGLGLKGSKQLADEFDIKSEPGKGTRVEIVKWL